MRSEPGNAQARATLLCVGLCSWLALSAVPFVAQAQSEDATRAASARALFQEGLQFADQDRWHEATDRFQRALALRESPVIAYNLASALEHLGALVKASELLRVLIADPATEPELRHSAEGSLAEITPRIARMTVHASGRQGGDRISIDDHELLDAQLDVPVPIDPGAHVISAVRGDQTLDSQTIEVSERNSLEVSLTLALARVPEPRAVAASAAPAPSAETARTDGQSHPSLTSRWWFWTGIGAVAAGVLVTALVVSSNSGSEQPASKSGGFDPPLLHVQGTQ